MNQKSKLVLFGIGVTFIFLIAGIFAPQSGQAETLSATHSDDSLDTLNHGTLPENLRDFFKGIKAGSQVAASASAIPAKTASTTTDTSGLKLSDEDLVAITKPSVVRLVVHAVGTSTIPSYDVDWATLTIKKNNKKPTEVPYDLYSTGSGFMIHPDGYILTNAHVASDEIIKLAIAGAQIQKILLQSLLAISKSPKEMAAMDKLGYGEKEGQELALKSLSIIRTEAVFKTELTIAVIKTDTGSIKNEGSTLLSRAENMTREKQRETAAKLLKDGMPAKVVAVNTKFLDDERDVALLKIEQKNLPALRLNIATLPKVSNPIFIFGYPANADNSILSDEPSFTRGTIGAFKASSNGTFKYIQTDAKISQGSSGGPVFNASGDVIGMITAETNPQKSGGAGDSFAFAIPSSLLKDTLEKEFVSPNFPPTYRDNFLAGLTLEKESRCKKALEKFEEAKKINAILGEVSSFVDSHIETCKNMVASGKSVDVEEERAAEEALKKQEADNVLWFRIKIGAGVLIFVVLLGGGILFFRKRRRTKDAIGSSDSGAEYAGTMPVVSLESQIVSPIDPQLLQYIAQARSVGQTDAQIREALLPNGWSDFDVTNALQNSLLGGSTPK